MLSLGLYGRFLEFEVVLIWQTDAYVFADRLDGWASGGYDDMGVPWITSPRNAWNLGLQRPTNLLWPVGKQEGHYFRVGNGGFSLRRVATLRRIAKEQQSYIAQLLTRRGSDNLHVEDNFLSLVAPELYPDMRIPDDREAVDFCIDRRPQLALKINGGRLPFACHGFNQRNARRFCQPILTASEKAPP
jgi:Protein of unknown function (DUF5672)